MALTRTPAQRRDYARQQTAALRTWDPDALRAIGFDRLNDQELSLRLADDPHQYRAQHRAQSAQLETAGAYLIPETFEAGLEMALLYASAIRDNASVIRTERGGKCVVPTADDTSVSGFELPENTLPSPNPDDITTFGGVALYARKWTSGWAVCPYELMEDAPEMFAGWLGALLGRRVARGQNTSFTGKVLVQATKGAQANSATAISTADLNALLFSVDAEYRDLPGCGWQLSSSVAQIVRNLLDGSGRPIFRPRETPESKDFLLGYPILGYNRDMATTLASGNISVAFGMWAKVVIRDVKEGRLRRLTERYADQDGEGFGFFLRSDVTIADAGTHPIKYLIH